MNIYINEFRIDVTEQSCNGIFPGRHNPFVGSLQQKAERLEFNRAAIDKKKY